MTRYKLTHPHTTTVRFPDFQSAANFIFNFRNSPDFADYILYDMQSENFYTVKNMDSGMGIEFTHASDTTRARQNLT